MKVLPKVLIKSGGWFGYESIIFFTKSHNKV